MKTCRILSLILALLLLMSLSVSVAESQEETAYTYGDFEYVLLEDGTAEITDYTGEATSLEIPDTLDRKTVRLIGRYAFSDCSDLTDISIPDSVTEIGDGAFDSELNISGLP